MIIPLGYSTHKDKYSLPTKRMKLCMKLCMLKENDNLWTQQISNIDIKYGYRFVMVHLYAL